jgi:membrane-associated phospholipid phosphatase
VIPTGLLLRLTVIVGALLALSAVTIVGRQRLRRLRGRLRERARTLYPYVGMLGLVLAVNAVARDMGTALSWVLDWNITGVIYAVEGEFVATLQAAGSPAVTAFLSFVYVYGYVFLLVFPILAYLALDDLQPFRHLFLAYAFNYAIGVVCYVLFIAYGPRNLMPELVDSLLYANWPRSQLLTSAVNSNTNVFPSLHTSLSVTVVLLAYRTRRAYPAWLALSVPLAGSVVLSTMYLGIHWGIDVLGGVVLGIASLYLADCLTDDGGRQRWLERTAGRVVAAIRTRVRQWHARLTDSHSRES